MTLAPRAMLLAAKAATASPQISPAGVPRDLVNRLATETAKAVASPDLKAKFEALGMAPVGNSPEQAARFLDDEIAK